jgi:hypothetical protein
MKYDERHGGPYDRGTADSYYGRGMNPHYYVGTTYNSRRVGIEEMTKEEIAAYRAGYEDNEYDQNFKEWN